MPVSEVTERAAALTHQGSDGGDDDKGSLDGSMQGRRRPRQGDGNPGGAHPAKRATKFNSDDEHVDAEGAFEVKARGNILAAACDGSMSRKTTTPTAFIAEVEVLTWKEAAKAKYFPPQGLGYFPKNLLVIIMLDVLSEEPRLAFEYSTTKPGCHIPNAKPAEPTSREAIREAAAAQKAEAKPY